MADYAVAGGASGSRSCRQMASGRVYIIGDPEKEWLVCLA